jgi:hypothetical protein
MNCTIIFSTPPTSHRSMTERNQLNIEHDKKTRTHAYSSIQQQQNQLHLMEATYSRLQNRIKQWMGSFPFGLDEPRPLLLAPSPNIKLPHILQALKYSLQRQIKWGINTG